MARFPHSFSIFPLLALCSPMVCGQEGRLYKQAWEAAATQASVPAASNDSLMRKALQEGERPKWVWGDNQDERYVISKSVPGGKAQAAWISASCDNHLILSLNGKVIGSSDEWSEGVTVDVAKMLKEGENLIEVEVWNDGGPAALVVKGAMVDGQGTVSTFGTDKSWTVAPKNQRDRKSAAKEVARYGDAPWGEMLGGATNSNQSAFAIPEGFAIERLFRVPKDELGSWVCLTTDPQGRLIASDQGDKGLVRITPPEPGTDQETMVEKLDVPITSAQGLLFAFDSLYVSVNGGPGSGLYRLRDTNQDDQFDKVDKLMEFRGGGEHGPHALRLAPDGKSIYVCCGNHTKPPSDRQLSAPPQTMGGPRKEPLRATLPEGHSSRIQPVWDEDLLLPRQWDANGHAAGILAPGGWIAKTDPEGKTWEMFTVGYRNQYDFDFNSAGEMFVYDADMEWDMGTPWYRPTRVVHATSGSEFGWRSGTGKWPNHYADSLPTLVDIGPGSPVGVAFGTGAKFPANYQKALFICDWTFGTMYAIHTVPDGATYHAVKEEFLSRTPLPLTDVTIGTDGHMYFTIGGRGTQSELYRVRYVGDQSTKPVPAEEPTDLMVLRKKLESYHRPGVANPEAVAKEVLAHLGHHDRYIRYAARVALEWLPIDLWKGEVLRQQSPLALFQGAIAMARMGDHADRNPLIDRLASVDVVALPNSLRLDYCRALQLALIRLGAIDDKQTLALREKLDRIFPSDDPALDRELVILLTFLQSPTLATKTLPLLSKESPLTEADFREVLQRNRGYGASISAMLDNQPDLQQFAYAFSLRNLKDGWTVDQKKEFFQWFQKAQGWQGGNSYQKFLLNAAEDAYANSNDQERFVLEATGLRKPTPLPKELPKPQGPGKAYSTSEIASWVGEGLKGRNFENGRNMYAAARCVVCHRFGGEGGATGPDLTQAAGRFAPNDLVDAIVRPSQVISDQYKTTIIQTEEGAVHTGRIVSDVDGKITMVVDPEDATKTVVIDRSEIETEKPSPVSLMPAELLDKLNREEVLDLVAFLLSRGDAQSPMFK
ncbi:MAG: c-type cytochrome [Pirellulaceae bacterium]